ncbi:MAG: hypothetical protein OXE05_00610 [Chloroflexi bacterium]|nr:hypothetical protein [Chloroflexota bacterium]
MIGKPALPTDAFATIVLWSFRPAIRESFVAAAHATAVDVN